MQRQMDNATDARQEPGKRPRPRRKTLPGFILKALLALALPLLLVLLTMPGPDGKPVISPAELSPEKWLRQASMDWLPSLPASDVTFYRWQDKKGHWHFSGQKPADTALFETVTVSGDSAKLPALTGENANKDASTGVTRLPEPVKNTATGTNQYTKGAEKP